ncbi:MAG: dihydropteroate synthase [Bacteroidetes bacterium]|nr:dihydropteroate synthase [Bacteroidota bacterium]HET6243669.1 dihydropteroate synthase [Bacteroidia bacterium]
MEAKDTFFYRNSTINCAGKLLSLDKSLVMGILNVSPDSFYDGPNHSGIEQILKRAKNILEDGGDIIDVGGESTRPGSLPIPVQDELKIIIPAIKAIKENFPHAIISIDTSKAQVAEKAVQAGAAIINDISGGNFDKAMFSTVAALKVPYILMHLKGKPETMQQNPFYEDVVKEVMLYFSEKISELREMGVNDIILDPGFGFGKNTSHNYTLLNRLDDFKIFNLPILAGFSRKRMINEILETTPHEALNGTTVLNTLALTKGVNFLRVHDVKEAVEAVKIITFAQRQSNNAY